MFLFRWLRSKYNAYKVNRYMRTLSQEQKDMFIAFLVDGTPIDNVKFYQAAKKAGE